ncbi:hypothetical protein [Nocardia sp. NPDC057353]|uniref:hypothetical protein n=1 Tax=Nocardia sp. NPDC057353 TaxID=3346104 RepID=UPI00363D2AD6
MRAFLVALIFILVAIACALAAAKGFRGTATSSTEGWGAEIPDTTRTDPARRKRANDLVAWCETTAALLCLPPACYALWVAADPEGEIPLPILIGLACYSVAVFSLAGYPIEKIKR